MKLRFKIQDILVVTALVALPVAFFAPELRSFDRNARVIFAVAGVITVLFIVSFSPVWVVLFWLRRRSRRGLGIRTFDYAFVFAAFLSGLGIIVGIGLAVRWLVVR